MCGSFGEGYLLQQMKIMSMEQRQQFGKTLILAKLVHIAIDVDHLCQLGSEIRYTRYHHVLQWIPFGLPGFCSAGHT